jgi:hypothetical protein
MKTTVDAIIKLIGGARNYGKYKVVSCAALKRKIHPCEVSKRLSILSYKRGAPELAKE